MLENVPEDVGELFSSLMSFYHDTLDVFRNMAESEEDYDFMVDDLNGFTLTKFNMFCKKNKQPYRITLDASEDDGHKCMTFMIVRVH